MPQPAEKVDITDVDTKEVETEKEVESKDTSVKVEKGDAEEILKETAEENKETPVVEDSTETPTGGMVLVPEVGKEAYIGTPPVKDVLSLTEADVMDWLVERFAQEVESYQFFTKLGKIRVRGDKFKISLDTVLRYLSINDKGNSVQDTITTIYVDRNKKTAVGYCEGFDTGLRRECEENELLDIPRELNFLEYNVKLPEDWLWEMIDEKPVNVEADKYYVNSRKVIRVFFNSEGKPSEIYFDERTGLPVRITTIEHGTAVNRDFEELTANKVDEKDVTHRDLDEIPSSEYFE